MYDSTYMGCLEQANVWRTESRIEVAGHRGEEKQQQVSVWDDKRDLEMDGVMVMQHCEYIQGKCAAYLNRIMMASSILCILTTVKKNNLKKQRFIVLVISFTVVLLNQSEVEAAE